jgi:3-polyprenyl-4-hydroxybenzoate decarboxylase
MPKDLRSWLTNLESRLPGEPLRISRPVAPASLEVAAVLHQLEAKGDLSAVLFERVSGVKGEPTDRAYPPRAGLPEDLVERFPLQRYVQK